MPAPIELDTPRLRLRVWQARHIPPFAALNADPEVMAYFPSTLDRAASDAIVDAAQARFAERGWGNWALARRDGGGFIGFAGLSVPQRVLPFGPCVEVGWRLARSAWGQGYATEAGREALRFGFEVLGLPEVVSFTTLANQRSRAVMVRLGLTDAGRNFEHPGVPEGHPLRPFVDEQHPRAGGKLFAEHQALRALGIVIGDLDRESRAAIRPAKLGLPFRTGGRSR